MTAHHPFPAAGSYQHGPPPGYGPPPPGYGPPPGHGYRPAPTPAPLSPDGRPLADFGTRLLAYVIDRALLGGLAMIVLLPAVLAILMSSVEPPSFTSAEPLEPGVFGGSWVVGSFWPLVLLEVGFVLFMLVAYYFYYVEMMYRSGQTLGKKWTGIKVVPLEPGATMTRGRATRRYLVEMVAGAFVPFFSHLDGLWQLWDKPYLQALHDKAAQTVVIKVAP